MGCQINCGISFFVVCIFPDCIGCSTQCFILFVLFFRLYFFGKQIGIIRASKSFRYSIEVYPLHSNRDNDIHATIEHSETWLLKLIRMKNKNKSLFVFNCLCSRFSLAINFLDYVTEKDVRNSCFVCVCFVLVFMCHWNAKKRGKGLNEAMNFSGCQTDFGTCWIDSLAGNRLV